ncbi:MAG TPA: ParA family protein [Planctomycetota bacterium]|nr:ParA family protein [Planctomycetota bacterium]
MRILAIFNQKGGVGKTSLAFHLGWYLSEVGQRTLLVDLDPQGNLSSLLDGQGCSAAHLFTKTGPAALETVEVRRDTPTCTGTRHFSLITSDESLQPLEATTNGLAGLTKLRKALRSAESRWDSVVIDCPPSLGGFSANAIVAADEVIVPCTLRQFSIHGLEHVCEVIQSTREEGLNPDVRILAIVLNQFKLDSKRKTVFERDIWSDVESRYGKKILPSSIPASIKIEEALYAKLPVWEYAYVSKDETARSAGLSYRAVVSDLVARMNAKVEGEAA